MAPAPAPAAPEGATPQAPAEMRQRVRPSRPPLLPYMQRLEKLRKRP
jgi:hypothetical protein